MAIIAAAAGGILVSLLKSKRPFTRSSGPVVPDPPSPRSPRSDCSETASQWLLSQAAGDRDDAGSERSSVRTLVLPSVTQRPLGAGTLVCFYNDSSELLVVKPAGKIWQLHPVPNVYPEGLSPTFLPTAAIFVVVKDDKQVGFQSFSANGSLLQAVKSQEAHRLASSRFGSWERWELTATGYVNSRWSKNLGFEVKELRCVLVEDLRRFERRHVKEKADLEDLAHAYLQERHELQDELAAMRSLKSNVTIEAEDLRHRVREFQQVCCKYKGDLSQKSTQIYQLENKVFDLDAEKQAATAAFEESARTAARNHGELLELQARIRGETLLRDEVHSREIARLRDERVAAVDAAVTACKEKEVAMARVLDHLERSVQLQAEQLSAVSAERDRLDVALQSISGQMERAPSSEASTCAALSLADSYRAVDALQIRELRAALLGSQIRAQAANADVEAQSACPSPEASAASVQVRVETESRSGELPEHSWLTASEAEQPKQKLGFRSHPHLQPLLIGQGPEKLLDLLNGDAHLLSAGDLQTPRIMTARHFANAISQQGEAACRPQMPSGNDCD